MAKGNSEEVDGYIGQFSGGQQARLQELRGIIQGVLPGAIETLKWNQPAYVADDGMILLVFSAHKNHMNLVVTPSAKRACDAELKDYKTGKGSVQLAYDKPLPKQLIQKIVKYRLDEYENKGVNWK